MTEPDGGPLDERHYEQPTPTLPEPDAVEAAALPCPNCGEECYDSITTWWDGEVPRCPRCAADMRYPIPTIEEQAATRRQFRAAIRATPSTDPLDRHERATIRAELATIIEALERTLG